VNDPDYHVDDLAPYSPKKLYYSTVAKMPMQIRIWQERFKGVDPSRAGRNHDVDLLAILDHMTAVTTHISITKYLQAWDDASNCHLSQGGARHLGLSAVVAPCALPLSRLHARCTSMATERDARNGFVRWAVVHFDGGPLEVA
jgi:hypothetical protein